MKKTRIIDDIEAMPFANAVKALALIESVLRQRLDWTKTILRSILETTFSDPFPHNLETDAFLKNIEGLKKLYIEFDEVRSMMKKRYETEIRQGKQVNGLKTCKYSRVKFIFPNI